MNIIAGKLSNFRINSLTWRLTDFGVTKLLIKEFECKKQRGVVMDNKLPFCIKLFPFFVLLIFPVNEQ